MRGQKEVIRTPAKKKSAHHQGNLACCAIVCTPVRFVFYTEAVNANLKLVSSPNSIGKQHKNAPKHPCFSRTPPPDKVRIGRQLIRILSNIFAVHLRLDEQQGLHDEGLDAKEGCSAGARQCTSLCWCCVYVKRSWGRCDL